MQSVLDSKAIAMLAFIAAKKEKLQEMQSKHEKLSQDLQQIDSDNKLKRRHAECNEQEVREMLDLYTKVSKRTKLEHSITKRKNLISHVERDVVEYHEAKEFEDAFDQVAVLMASIELTFKQLCGSKLAMAQVTIREQHEKLIAAEAWIDAHKTNFVVLEAQLKEKTHILTLAEAQLKEKTHILTLAEAQLKEKTESLATAQLNSRLQDFEGIQNELQLAKDIIQKKDNEIIDMKLRLVQLMHENSIRENAVSLTQDNTQVSSNKTGESYTNTQNTTYDDGGLSLFLQEEEYGDLKQLELDESGSLGQDSMSFESLFEPRKLGEEMTSTSGPAPAHYPVHFPHPAQVLDPNDPTSYAFVLQTENSSFTIQKF
jgi:hypothetical protein